MGKHTASLALAIALVSLTGAYAVDSPKAFATVTVKNETGYYLIEVNTAADGETEWSPSILGEDVAIRPFREREVRVEPGYASLRALFDVDGTEVEVVEDADFEAGGEYVWTITEDAIWENYSADGDSAGDAHDTYGYYDDTYGYYDDTYGYYGE
jgi:hypothetical protein